MLRSVSHRFALVKRYLLDRFAFGFRLLAGLHCIAFPLACQPLLFLACFRLRVQRVPLLRWFELYHVSALLVNPFLHSYFVACNMQDSDVSD